MENKLLENQNFSHLRRYEETFLRKGGHEAVFHDAISFVLSFGERNTFFKMSR